MNEIFYPYKFRLLPNKQQIVLLNKYFGATRFVYNYFLNKRKEQYTNSGYSDNYYKQSKELTLLKKTEEYKWLKEINSQVLQYSLRMLEVAYTNFFKKISGFPNFKKKKGKNSFTIPQFCKLENNKIIIPKFDSGIKIIKHRDVVGKIHTMTISKDSDGKFYVSILTSKEYNSINKTNKSIGIDLGIKDLVVTSDGNIYKNHKFLKKYENKLKTAQKHLSRKQKDSNSFEKQKRKVAKIHKKIFNSRNDKLHKISTDLVKKYDIICCENLNVVGMFKNRKLSKAVSDSCFGNFIFYLTYKCERENKTLIKVDRYFPSSQMCYNCGYINKLVKNLNIRNWICPNCGTEHNRDINAAKNILREGLKSLSAGTYDYTNGDNVRLACKQLSMKLEA